MGGWINQNMFQISLHEKRPGHLSQMAKNSFRFHIFILKKYQPKANFHLYKMEIYCPSVGELVYYADSLIVILCYVAELPFQHQYISNQLNRAGIIT